MATDNKSSGGTSSSSGSGTSGKPGSTPSSSSTSSKRPVTIDLKAEKIGEKPGASTSREASSASPSSKPATSDPAARSATSSASKPASSSATPSASSGTARSPSATPSSTASASKSASASSSATSSGATSSGTASSTSASKPASASASAAGKTAASTGGPASSSSTSRPSSTTPTTFANPPAAEDRGGVGAFGVLIAAVIGGILVLGGGFGLHQAGLIKITPEPNQQMANALSTAEGKISDLEKQLGALSSGGNTGADNSAVSALEAKVAALESRLDNATPASSPDVVPAMEALQKDVESLRSDMASLGSGDGAPVNLKPLEDRMAALEKASNAGTAVDLEPLEARLAKLEAASNSTTSEADKLSGSVTGIETQVDGLKKTLSEVETRLQNTEATAKAAQSAVSTSDVSLKTLADSQARATETLASLSADIKSMGTANSAALEDIRAELDALSKRLASVEATMGDATARETAARALSVSALKSAVDSGRSYETELAAVKAGLPTDIDLTALEAHAASGVEPVSVLIAQFPPVARSVYQTFSEPDREGDVLDSFLASAKSLIAVRGPGDADGTGPEAALRRMENAVSAGDLSGALAAYKDLPETARTVASDWAARAQARVEVDALTEKASKEVLNALAGKDS
ncbi:hypothetical protein [Roseibium sp.]|uniref:COG4223 family protein n=1 Tax=Roseibium sp. TaxID=1936156 RepID=UPI003D0A3808